MSSRIIISGKSFVVFWKEIMGLIPLCIFHVTDVIFEILVLVIFFYFALGELRSYFYN